MGLDDERSVSLSIKSLGYISGSFRLVLPFCLLSAHTLNCEVRHADVSKICNNET